MYENGAWTDVNVWHLSQQFTTQTFDVSDYLPAEGEYKLRLRHNGLKPAHVDYVALAVDGVEKAPATAVNLDGNADVLFKVQGLEHDVVDVTTGTLEFTWNTAGGNALAFVFNAREEGTLPPDPFTTP